jgi:hypothetical protein
VIDNRITLDTRGDDWNFVKAKVQISDSNHIMVFLSRLKNLSRFVMADEDVCLVVIYNGIELTALLFCTDNLADWGCVFVFRKRPVNTTA